LIFDVLLNDQSPAISYDVLTGEFTISQVGNYFVTWWIATNGSGQDTDVHFTVSVGGVLYSMGASPIVTGQLSGSALITVSSTPTIVTLVNTSADIVSIATTPTQANIVILELSV
jgi:hypothetical protein